MSPLARVVKLVDAGDSKSPAARRAGSIPAPGTSNCTFEILSSWQIVQKSSFLQVQMVLAKQLLPERLFAKS